MLLLSSSFLVSACASSLTSTRAQWHVAHTERFEVLTDDDSTVAVALVEDLERFHQVVLRLTNTEDREAVLPLRVFMTRDGFSYRALGGNRRHSGYFAPRRSGNFAVIDLDAARAPHDSEEDADAGTRRVLFHEYLHYVVALAGGGAPPWYNEGLAEYMATTQFRDDGSYTHACPPQGRTRWAEYVRWISLERLFATDDMSSLRGAGVDTYLEAWAVVHYFLSSPERKKQCAAFLEATQRGTDVADAGRAAFGMDLDELDELIHDYARSTEFACLSIRPSVPLAVHDVRLEALSPARAQLKLGEFLFAFAGPTDRALSVLAAATELAPDDPRAHAEFARIHLRRAEHGAASQSLEAAHRHLRAAKRLDAEAPRTLLAEAEIAHHEAAQLAKSGREDRAVAALNHAREAYRAAIRVDDTLTDAYYGLGSTYLLHDNGSEEPVVALEAANYLAPLDLDAALSLADLHVRRENRWKAVPVLEYVRRNLRDSESRTRLDDLLARIRAAD